MTFEASVDRTTRRPRRAVHATSLTLEGQVAGGGKNLQLPDLSKFHIMAGPNQSTSMQIINGAVSSSVTYCYVLQPKEIGTFTIGPAPSKPAGTVLRTRLSHRGGEGRRRAQSRQQAAAGIPPAQLGENLFLRAVVDRTQVMQGEQVNLVFKLYTRVSVVNYAVSKNPAMTGLLGRGCGGPARTSRSRTKPSTGNRTVSE